MKIRDILENVVSLGDRHRLKLGQRVGLFGHAEDFYGRITKYLTKREIELLPHGKDLGDLLNKPWYQVRWSGGELGNEPEHNLIKKD
jgi:hypothetical protein